MNGAQEIWKDLELSDVAQEQQLADITERALGVWNGAVEHAEQHRQGIRKRIEDAVTEMKTIADLLGEINAIEDTSSSVVRTSAYTCGARCSHAQTLRPATGTRETARMRSPQGCRPHNHVHLKWEQVILA
jgi:hypothetical protein